MKSALSRLMVQWNFCAFFLPSQDVDTFAKLFPFYRLNVKIHLLAQRRLTTFQFVYRHILADLFPRNNLLVQDSSCSPLEDVALLLLAALVRLDVSSL